MPATRPGVGDRRTAMLDQIVKSREGQIDQELKESGVKDGIAALQAPDKRPAAGTMPEGTDPAEWAALSEEARAALIEVDEQRKKVEAEAAAGETDEAKAARDAKEKEEAEQKAAADASAQAAAASGAPRKVKLKVDGKDVEVDESQVLEAGRRALQKESAADKRLEDASKQSAEAARLLTEAQNMIRAAAQGATAKGAGPSATDGAAQIALSDEDLAKTAKAIQYGSEAEAQQALKNLIAAAAGSGQSEELTEQRVNEMLDFREARQWAETEYKDVLGDSNLRTIFKMKEREKRAAGDGRSYRELYAEIGNEVRDWKKTLAPANPNPATGGKRVEVLERKSTLVTVPSAAARQPTPTQPKEPTPSETVSKMREARGQK